MPKARTLSGQTLAEAIYAITDKLEGEFAAEFIALMRKLSKRKALQELLNQIESGAFASVASIPTGLTALKLDTSKLNAIARKAMGSAARITDEKVGLGVSFNVRNPTIIEAARNISVDLSTNLSQTSQKIIDKVIGDAMEGLVTRREAVKIIESRVGLLPAHSDAVDRYYDTLIQSGATKANAKKLADKYADRLLRYRANTIARTEIARATGIGQTEFWRQAIADGSLPPDIKRVWSTSYDERVCEVCGPMNNSEVGIFEQWLTPNGFVDYPSAIHPNCRCSQGIALSASQKRMFVGKSDEEQFQNYLLSKFNPNHDELGRFTSASGGRRVSRMPKSKSKVPKTKIREYKNKNITVIDQDTPKETDIEYLGSKHGQIFNSNMRLINTVKNIFEVKLKTSEGEISVEVMLAYRDLPDDVISVKGYINKDGKKIGDFEVNIDPEDKSAKLELIRISNEFQGKGIGTALTAHWEDQFARAGVNKISLFAVSGGGGFGSYNGAYTWAVLGYKPTMNGAKKTHEQFLALLSNGGMQNKPVWAIRTKLIETLGITADKDAADMISDGEILKKMKIKYGNNFLKLMSDIPLFKEFLKGTTASGASYDGMDFPYVGAPDWNGSKKPRKIQKTFETELDIIDKWIKNNPAGLENDDPSFWKEIKNYFENNDISYDDDIEKFNPNHDELGRFTFTPAGKRISAKPKMSRRALGLKGKVTSLIRFSSAERKVAVEKLATEGSSKLLMPPDANGIAQVLPESKADKRYGKTVSQIEKSIKKLGVESITTTPDFAKGKNAKRQMQATAQALEEAKAMGIPIDRLTMRFTTALRDADGTYAGDPDKRAGDMVIDYTDDQRAKLIADKVANDSGPRIINAPTVAQTEYTSDYPVITSQEDLVAKYTYGVAVHEIGHHYTYVNANNPNAKRQFGLETPAKYGTSDVYEMLAEGFTAWWLLGRSRVKSTQTFYKRWLPFVKVVLNGNDTGFGIPTPEALLKAMVRKTKVLNLLTLSPAHPLMVYLTDGASIPDDIEKFNPNHDELGRFTFASDGRRVSRMPKKEVKKPVMVFGDKYIDPSVVDVKTVESKKIQGMTIHIGMAGDKPKEAYAKYTSPKNGVTYDIISDNAGNTYAYVEGTGGKPHNRVAKLEIMVNANGDGKHEIYEVNTTNSHLRQGVASAMLEVSRMLLGGVFAPNSLTDQGSKWWEKVSKFNPYHDELGRFTSAGGKTKGKILENKKFKRQGSLEEEYVFDDAQKTLQDTITVQSLVKSGVMSEEDYLWCVNTYIHTMGFSGSEKNAMDAIGETSASFDLEMIDDKAVFYKIVVQKQLSNGLRKAMSEQEMSKAVESLSKFHERIPNTSKLSFYGEMRQFVGGKNGKTSEQAPMPNETLSDNGDSIYDAAAEFIISSWAGSSGGQTSLMMSAYAEAVLQAEGTYRQSDYEESMRKAVWYFTTGVGERQLDKLLRTSVKTIYDNTQKVLDSQGIDTVRVYRGFGDDRESLTSLSRDKPIIDEISTRPLSSWSLSPDIATSFGSFVASKVVSKTQIFATPMTGMGCFEEAELVLKGFDLRPASIVWSSGGDSFNSRTIKTLDDLADKIAKNPKKYEDY